MTAAADEVEPDQPPLRPLGWKDVVSSVGGLALVVVLIAWGLPHLLHTSWAEIWAQLSRVRPATALAMAGLLFSGLFCYTWVLIGSLPGLGHVQALKINAVTSMVANILPLGAAVGLALSWMMWRTWGFSRRAISTSLMATALWNVLARVTLPVIGCLVLVASPIKAPEVVKVGAVVAGAVGTALVLLVVLAIRSDVVAGWLGRTLQTLLAPLSRRIRQGPGMEHLVADQRHRLQQVVRTGGWTMTLGVVGEFVLLFGLYWLAARVVGLDLPLAELICAYTFRQLLTVMAVTPGGLGVTEVGTAGMLVLLGGSPGAASATALLYAIYAHALVVPFGVAALAAWRLGSGRDLTPTAPSPT